MDFHQVFGSVYHDSNLSGIQQYLETGGDPNYQHYTGDTVFIKAIGCPSDNINVINELINAGADVNHSTHLGNTPLLLAVFYRKRRVSEKLIESGASVNAKDFLGRTILHAAVTKWVLSTPIILIEYDPDILIINELLKLKNIDCNQVDFYGKTPLMVAVANNEIEITSLLLRNNANPNLGNELSETPLHVAFSLPGNYAAMELLHGGASIYSVDKRGRTPLDVLIENGLDVRWNQMVYEILKVIAFRYSITRDVKQKFELIPQLSQVFNQCCKEVDDMRRDFICGNITMHDFIYGCFVESDPDILVQQIHKPLVERLVSDIYPVYFIDVIVKIPKASLCMILQMNSEKYCRVNGLSYLLSRLDINELISTHLSHGQIFVLILAFSGLAISE